MAITQSGNFTFAGNYLAGDAWEPNDLLAFIRTALGDNNKASINRVSTSSWRIDWQDSNGSGVVGVATASAIQTNIALTSPDGNLAANATFALSPGQAGTSAPRSMYLMSDQAIAEFTPSTGGITPVFSSAANYWAVGVGDAISVFIKEGANYAFWSQGIPSLSGLSYPNNKYSLAVGLTVPRIRSDFQNGTGLLNMFTSTAIANYPHTKLSDGQPTQSEVELVLRRQSDNAQLGIIPGLFKVKIDGAETAPAIGETIVINIVENVRTLYSGLTTIFAVVVGRLGNTSENDLTGDYLAMYVAGAE